MPPKTRLDPLVKLRSREEEKAQIVLAAAGRDVEQARQNLAEAEVRMLRDARIGAQASHWEVAEQARARAAHELRHAADEVTRAKFREEQARIAYIAAHRNTEVMRRAADRRREELVREADRAENKAIDAVATLMFSHKR